MKPILLISLLSFSVFANGQKKDYKEYEACTKYEVYKGKKNHGKYYCVVWQNIREYKDGRKDTLHMPISFAGKSFVGDEYEVYQRLDERGKYIVDSLSEDGITMLDNTYLSYEPLYMKPGKKIEKFWMVMGTSIFITEYLIWNRNGGSGFELKKEYEVK